MNRREKLRTTEFGEEKYCHKCKDWFPNTDEFFFVQRGKLRSPCKACIQEKRFTLKVCCVEGCNQPRKMLACRPGSRCVTHERQYRADYRLRKAVK